MTSKFKEIKVYLKNVNFTDMTVKERLMLFIKEQGIAVKAFEKACGLSNGYMRQLKNSPTVEKMEKILAAYPQLNETWLLTGQGDMRRPSGDQGSIYTVGQRDDETVVIDFVPLAAQATFVESLSNCSFCMEQIAIVPYSDDERLHPERYKAFEVRGDSMSPGIPDRALILTKEIPEAQWHYAEGVVVAVYSEFLVVKRVKANRLLTHNTIILSSDNEQYGDMTIPLGDLRALYKARRIITAPIF